MVLKSAIKANMCFLYQLVNFCKLIQISYLFLHIYLYYYYHIMADLLVNMCALQFCLARH
jgi:hypothetical protein